MSASPSVVSPYSTDLPSPTAPLQLRPSEGVRLFLQDLEEYAVLLLQRNGRILIANLGAERLLGYKACELVGQHYSMLFPPEDLRQGLREQELIRARDEGRAQQVVWHVRQDGSRILTDVVVRPLRPDGAVVGYSVILRDVTEERRAMEALHSRTAELEQLLKQKDAFLAMVSHELRSPLGGIFNALEIIRHDPTANALQQRAREVIERQTRHLSKLVDDLLEASRVAAGKIDLRTQEIDMRVALDRAVETCRPLLETRRHALRLEVAEQPLVLQADPTRLEQVVINLLTNAAKYTPEGGRIDVSLERDGDQAGLRVRDTGMGIAPELISRVFDLFTQANHRSQDGLGIGLAVVRRLVELHGGTVEANSPGIGLGSEFVVRLPLAFRP